MTTEQEAIKMKNKMMMFGVCFAALCVVAAIYKCIISGTGVASLILLLGSSIPLKIAYDAYSTPLLYLRQYLSTRNNYEKQVTELRRTHQISRYNWLWSKD